MCDAPLAPPPPQQPAVDLKAANRAPQPPPPPHQPQPQPPQQHQDRDQRPPHSNGTPHSAGDSPETPPPSEPEPAPQISQAAQPAQADAVDDAGDAQPKIDAHPTPAPPAPITNNVPIAPEPKAEPVVSSAPSVPSAPATLVAPVAPLDKDKQCETATEPEPAPAPQPPKQPTPQPPETSTVPSEPALIPSYPNGDDAGPPKPDNPPPTEPLPEPETAAEAPRPVLPENQESDKTEPTPAASTPVQKKTEIKPKSTLKLATVAPTIPRKRKKETKDGPSPKKSKEDGDESADGASVERPSSPDNRPGKRNRTKVQPYQSPTPELAIITKLSSVSRSNSTPSKQNDDKLIVFYKNEFLAVRNAEGGFYVCQTVQNVYRTTRKFKIRWLSQDKAADPSGEIYKPDFYDVTDIDCVLTTLSLQRAGSAGLKLGATELARTQSILGRALAAERGEPAPDSSVTEEHPDGLDLSLYKDESQLEKKGQRSKGGRHSRKRTHSKSSPIDRSDSTDDGAGDAKSTPKRHSSLTPKKSKTKTPKKSKKAKSHKKTPNKDKQNNTSLPPISASTTNKTATTPGKSVPGSKAKKSTPKSASKNSPASRRNTPKSASAKAAAAKAAQLASTPSTSTGKATRTPRKPPSKK